MADSDSNSTPPAHSAALLISFPAPKVLLLTLNRPKQLNAMSPALEADMYSVLRWFESEPGLWLVLAFGGRLRWQIAFWGFELRCLCILRFCVYCMSALPVYPFPIPALARACSSRILETDGAPWFTGSSSSLAQVGRSARGPISKRESPAILPRSTKHISPYIPHL